MYIDSEGGDYHYPAIVVKFIFNKWVNSKYVDPMLVKLKSDVKVINKASEFFD